jgi:hypothetical protein
VAEQEEARNWESSFLWLAAQRYCTMRTMDMMIQNGSHDWSILKRVEKMGRHRDKA